MKPLKKVWIFLTVLGLGGCQTVRVLDERVSARLQRSGWLRPAPAWVVRPAKAGAAVKLRAGPGTGHAAIRDLLPGEAVTPLGSVGAWRAVRVGPESGYVRSRDLRADGKDDRGLFAQP
ncbi:MAG: SH3 domain-containing protein [bacterium]|nr:SH3 domain-containing protein [bacterium]